MATTRLYKVATPTGDRLIETTNPSRAVAHVAKSQYTVTIPASHEVYRMATEGIKIEVVGADEISDETRTAVSQTPIEA